MTKKLAMFAGCLMVLGLVCLSAEAADGEKPKYSIEDVMKKGMNPKTGLMKTVTDGGGSDADKVLLHEMFVALSEGKPHKGDAESWKEKTTALVVAAKAVVDGDSEGMNTLKAAANCKACHSVHK